MKVFQSLSNIPKSWLKLRKYSKLKSNIGNNIVGAAYSQSELNKIINSIKVLRATSTVKVSIKYLITAGDLKRLCLTLKKLKALNKLHLKIPNLFSINDKELELSFSCLRYLSALSTLKLELFSYPNFEQKGLNTLSSSLRHLTSLSHLKLAITGSCSREIGNILIALQYIQTLSVLELEFPLCKDFVDQDLELLNLQYLKSLSTFRLFLLKCDNITDAGIKHFSGSLAHIKGLSNLQLLFYACENITDQGLESISSVLPHLHYLSKLDLNFTQCEKIGDKGIVSLSLNLKRLHSLKTCTLNFTSTNAGNKAYKSISGLKLFKTFPFRPKDNIKVNGMFNDCKISHLVRLRIFWISSLFAIILYFIGGNWLSYSFVLLVLLDVKFL